MHKYWYLNYGVICQKNFQEILYQKIFWNLVF